MNVQLAHQHAGDVLSMVSMRKDQGEIDAKIENSIKYLSGIEKGLADHFIGRLKIEELMVEEKLNGIKNAISKSEVILAG